MDILTILKTIFTLIAVIFLAVFVLRFLNKEMKKNNKAMYIVERLQLSNSSSLNIVKIIDEYYLISFTDKNIELLKKLDSDEVELLLASNEASKKENMEKTSYNFNKVINKLKRSQ